MQKYISQKSDLVYCHTIWKLLFVMLRIKENINLDEYAVITSA